MEESLALVAETSTQYVGRWNRLVSTTNWEKGRIISEWRQALEQAGADSDVGTDEVWSQQVGGVTPQHVGRLRRVHERFGQVHQDYAGLYWSHFQVAVEWDDAEMWLEGAVQSHWSVARMCDQRWEALGSSPDSQPQESDSVASDMDEDMVADQGLPSTILSDSPAEVHGDADSYFGDEDSGGGASSSDDADVSDIASDRPGESMNSLPSETAAEPVRPFEALPSLPPDMNEAFELFKLAILNQKVSGWREVARNDVLSVLEALKQLALAPTE